MPRNYNTFANSGGTNMVGRAYTPQVAPWDRDSDDVSVQHSLRDDNQEWRDRRDDRYERNRDYGYRGRGQEDYEQDAYYRRDLVPGYGDDRRGYQNSGNSERDYQSDDRTYHNQTGYRDERDDGHRAGHRKHWENREPDYRYQYNNYQRTDDNEMRRENLARHRDDSSGYRRENDRAGWMSRNRSDYGREDYDRDRYNDRERYYARNDEDRDRGRWNRR